MGTLARIDSDITDYDYSTDSESLRFFFSETDPSGTHGSYSTIQAVQMYMNVYSMYIDVCKQEH
jgi:hypothetical protein